MKNSTIRSFVPSQLIITKLGTTDNVRDSNSHAKFRIFMPILFSRYRLAAKLDDRPRRPVAQNASPCKDVPFGGFDQKCVPTLPSLEILWMLP